MLRPLIGVVALVAAPFVEWSASTDLGHARPALEVPLRFLWADSAVTSEVSLGHVLLGFALVGLVGAPAPLLRPLATGAGAGVIVLLVWYLVRFTALTAVVVPFRAAGPGIVLAAAGGILLVSTR